MYLITMWHLLVCKIYLGIQCFCQMLIFCLFCMGCKFWWNNFQGHYYCLENMLSEEIRALKITFEIFVFECWGYCKINDLFWNMYCFYTSVMIAYKLSVRRNVINAQKVPEIKLTCYGAKKASIQIYLEIQYLLAFQKNL